MVGDLLAQARKINNWAEDATGGGLWIDTTHFTVTCPVGKRWFFYGGMILRDASQAAQVIVYDSTDEVIHDIYIDSATTTRISFPADGGTDFIGYPIILDTGEYISIIFGGAQGANAECALPVLEIDI